MSLITLMEHERKLQMSLLHTTFTVALSVSWGLHDLDKWLLQGQDNGDIRKACQLVRPVALMAILEVTFH